MKYRELQKKWMEDIGEDAVDRMEVKEDETMLGMIKGAPDHINKSFNKLLVTRAKWETVNQMDKETKNEVLRDNNFYEEGTLTLITNERDDFLMSDSDFEKYGAMVYKRNLEKGIDSGGADFTFYQIRKEALEAEDAFIDAVTANIPAYTPDMVDIIKHNINQRDKFFSIIGL